MATVQIWSHLVLSRAVLSWAGLCRGRSGSAWLGWAVPAGPELRQARIELTTLGLCDRRQPLSQNGYGTDFVKFDGLASFLLRCCGAALLPLRTWPFERTAG